jgi:type IV pilus assembly protein PilA
MRRHRPSRRAEDGFTLIELLVVVLIVGILAAIAVPALLTQRAKAQDAEAKEAAVTAHKAMLVYHVDHDGYGGATPAALVDIEASLANASGLAVAVAAGGFTVSVDSRAGSAGGASFSVERDAAGRETRTCGNPGHGSCPTDGTW